MANSLAENHLPPIVVINTAHAGSRLLAGILAEAGVHMGNNLPVTMDCLDLEPFVQGSILKARGPFPIGAELDDPELRALFAQGLARHLDGVPPGQRWGWKLCETLLLTDLVEHYFPDAIFVHLVRDARDVAFSPFVAPKTRYWRKVYFGSATLRAWRGFPMTQRAYRAYGYLFNAARWRYHTDHARAFGQRIGPRYVEVRYEDLVLQPDETREALFAALGIATAPVPSGAGPNVYSSSIGKWENEPAEKIQHILDIVEPVLSSFGYRDAGLAPRRKTASLLDRLRLGAIL